MNEPALPARVEIEEMSSQMLTEWSAEYVDAFFKSDLAKEPRLGRFHEPFERDAFIEGMKHPRFASAQVESLGDGLGVRVTGATPDNLLEMVTLARHCGGEIFFAGALPR